MTTRAFQELSPFECVLVLADRYDVEVTILPSRGRWRTPRGSQGPAGHYVRAPKVWLEASVMDLVEAATEFHEVVHAIFAPPRELRRALAPEHYGLLQFELALARVVFAHRRRQIADVRAYQGITFVDETRKVGDWPRCDRTRWWRTGLAFAHEIDLLRDDQPTWRRPTWPSLARVRAHVRECDEAVRATPSPARAH
jgi:hypothetical protein